MIRRRLWVSLIGIVTVAVVLLGANLIARNEPVLGLDLQGGISVVLAPADGATSDDLIVIRDLIRDELEDRGIAEPDVRVEGENILVDLPGVRDQRDALDAVDVAGIVSLRPVVQPCQAPIDPATVSGSSVPDSAVDSSAAGPGDTGTGDTSPSDTGAGATADPDSTTAADSTVTTPDTGTTAGSTDPAGPAGSTDPAGPSTADGNGSASTAAGFRSPAGADTTSPADADTTDPADATDPAGTSPGSSDPATSVGAASAPPTSASESGSSTPDTSGPDDSGPGSSEPTESTTTSTTTPLGPLGPNPLDAPDPSPYGPPPPPSDDSTIELPTRDGLVCTVGPVERGPNGESGGFVFSRSSAQAVLNGASWMVTVGLSDDGAGTFNQLAFACYNAQQNCPTQQLAIVLDDEIVTYPRVQTPNFQDEVSITGTFTESEARSLARVLDRGAFPVDVNAENVQTVSATLGNDSMTASILAGLVGVALVLLLLVYFYRRLVLVVLAGVAVWGMLIYSMSTFISETTNYALTLAGVTGIIVAIGVTVDTYVVYFERLKEEVRHGRTVRNSALRSFRSTWRTILAADFVALIAAVVLFTLSVGSVRGFALYLGVTTVCDLVVCYFFTRPAVSLLADTGWLDRGDTFGLKDYQ